MDLKQIKTNRFLFLQALYEGSNGDTKAMFNMWDAGEELNFDSNETQRIVDYLIGENLIEARALGGAIGLTHWGIKEVEEALENPDEPTEHFLPINIINIGAMNNSSLQQATNNSTINFNIDNNKLDEIDKILSFLKTIQDELNISNELHTELISELQTIESQRQSPKPKSVIISESLKSIRTILESAAGNAMTPIIVDQISKLLG
jgi:hypothetical protein